MIHQTTLTDFTRRYVENRTISPIYAGTLKRRALALEVHAGRTAVADVLTEARVNAFLASLAVAPYTLKSYRGDLLTLWRAAADDDLAPYPIVRRIRRERLPSIVVECYELDEVRAILKAAEKMTGCLISGIARRRYWAAIIRVAWDSGLRRGDCWRVRRDAVRPDGTLLVAQHKTGRLALCRLRASTVAALDKIREPTPLAWPHNPWTFGEQFWKLAKAAGVNRGSFRWLRRSSGSYVEAAAPGCGFRHLGHADSTLFTKHYDARLDAASLPQPPEL